MLDRITWSGMKRRTPHNLELRAVIYRDQQWWVAHCLELNLAASSDESAERAIDDLLKSVDLQLQNADDLDAIVRPAAPEVWAMYFRAMDHHMGARASKLRAVKSFTFRKMQSAA